MPSPCAADLAAKRGKKEKKKRGGAQEKREREKKKEKERLRPETRTGRTTIIAFGDNARAGDGGKEVPPERGDAARVP